MEILEIFELKKKKEEDVWTQYTEYSCAFYEKDGEIWSKRKNIDRKRSWRGAKQSRPDFCFSPDDGVDRTPKYWQYRQVLIWMTSRPRVTINLWKQVYSLEFEMQITVLNKNWNSIKKKKNRQVLSAGRSNFFLTFCFVLNKITFIAGRF